MTSMLMERRWLGLDSGILNAMATSKPCVYVIELKRTVLKNKKFLEKNPDIKKGKPCVYVGRTGLDPEERFKRHMSGIQSGRGYVKKFGKRLRPDLVPNNMKHFKTTEQAMSAEKELADQLRARGFPVWQN